MGEYIIGVDIGTQGTKAALFDLDLHMVCTAFEKSKLISPEPGVVWQEADDIYLSCARTIRELVERSGILAGQIAAIGIDGQMAGIMGIDREGEATTYYDSWLDMRSSTYVQMMKSAGGDQMVQSSGGQLCSNHSSKILWWKYENPQVYQRTAKFVLPHGYVVGKMTGLSGDEAIFDYTCLHFNNFSDNIKKEWSEEILSAFDVGIEKMPRIVSPFQIAGYTTKEFADISGTIQGIPVAAGAGDTAASTFGSGMFEREMIQDCAGTASVLCCVVNEYVPDTANHTLTMMRSPVDGLWLPLAYINGGGMCIRWFRDQFTGFPPSSYERLEQEAFCVPAGSEGLLFCPHFSGRVLPEDSTLKGSFVNLDFKHTRGHLYRSILEGIAFEYQYYISVLRRTFPQNQFDRMITIGGGANSPLFNQIKADALNVTVDTFTCGETALIGSAAIAALGAGIFKNYQEPIRNTMNHKDTYIPDETAAEQYQKCGIQYGKMLDNVSGLYKNL